MGAIPTSEASVHKTLRRRFSKRFRCTRTTLRPQNLKQSDCHVGGKLIMTWSNYYLDKFAPKLSLVSECNASIVPSLPNYEGSLRINNSIIMTIYSVSLSS